MKKTCLTLLILLVGCKIVYASRNISDLSQQQNKHTVNSEKIPLKEYFPKIDFTMALMPYTRTLRYETLDMYDIDRDYRSIGAMYRFFLKQPLSMFDVNLEKTERIEYGLYSSGGSADMTGYSGYGTGFLLYFSKEYRLFKSVFSFEPKIGYSSCAEGIVSATENESCSCDGIIMGIAAGLEDLKIGMDYSWLEGAGKYTFRDISGRDIEISRLSAFMEYGLDRFAQSGYSFLKGMDAVFLAEFSSRRLIGGSSDYVGYKFMVKKVLNRYLRAQANVTWVRPLGYSPEIPGMVVYHMQRPPAVEVLVSGYMDFSKIDFNKVKEFLIGRKRKIFKEETGLFNERDDNPEYRMAAAKKAQKAFSALGAEKKKIIGIVSSYYGDVEIMKKDTLDWVPMESNCYLNEGDRIYTEAGSNASVILVDGSVLKAGEKTELAFGRVSKDSGFSNVIEQSVGELFMEAVPSRALRPAVEVRTPSGSVYAEKSLVSIVVETDGRAIVRVRDGSALMSGEGYSSMVEKGSGALISNNKQPVYFGEINWERSDEWLKNVLINDETRIDAEEFSKLMFEELVAGRIKSIMQEKQIKYEEKAVPVESIEIKDMELISERNKVFGQVKNIDDDIKGLRKDKQAIAEDISRWYRHGQEFKKDSGNIIVENLRQLEDVVKRLKEELVFVELDFSMLDAVNARMKFEKELKPIDDGKLRELEAELKEWEKDIELNRWGYDERFNRMMLELFRAVTQIKNEMDALVNGFNRLVPYMNDVNEEVRIIDLSREILEKEKEKARKGEKRITVTLTEEVIRFETNKAEVHERYFPALEKIAEVFKGLKGYKVAIEGYTDNVGSREYNLALSLKRARNITDYFVKKYGLPGDIFVPMGYGEERPVAGNNTPEGREKNRRVEFVLVSE